MDSFNEVINWDEDELAHLFRGMLLPLVARRKFPTPWTKNTTVLVETEMLPFFHQMVDFHSEARKSWFLQLVTPATHPEVFRGNNPHLARSISMVDALLIGMWSRTISCYLGAKIHVWAKCCDGGFMLWTASCVFFRFNELKLNDCCYCCGKQRSADQLFRKLACVFVDACISFQFPRTYCYGSRCFVSLRCISSQIWIQRNLWHTSTWTFPMEINL